MPEIRYLPAAQKDLMEILEYIKKDKPGAASDFIQLVDKKIGLLASFPALGKLPADERLKKLGYRVLAVENYLIFYVIKDYVEVRRIVHGRRLYEYLL